MTAPSPSARFGLSRQQFGIGETGSVRSLFCFAGGLGHATPMIPVAEALLAAGHEVSFAGDERYLARLRSAGFATHAVDHGAGVPELRQPLVTPDLLHEEQVIRNHYVGRLPRRRVAAYRELFQAWRPDLVVADEADFGATVVAEQCGLAHVTVLVTAAGLLARPAVVNAALDDLRARFEMSADPAGTRRYGDLVLSPFLPALRDPTSPLPPGTISFGPPRAAPAVADGPEIGSGWGGGSDRPLVYLTLGTVFPLESGDLLDRLLAGLAALPVEVAAALGPDLDPTELGIYPPHVHVERWLPQTEVVARSALVVSHGGSGTLNDAVRSGVPQLVVALGADQLHNAERVVALGVGRSLDPMTCTAAEVSAAASAVLGDPAYAARAAGLAAEAAALPGPEVVVPALLELVTRTR